MTKILGVKIDEYSFSEVMAKIHQFLADGKFHQIVTVNPEFILAARKDKEFRKVLNSADLKIPDGVGLQFAAWFLGQKIGERLTGVDLTWEIAKICAQKNKSIFFLGGKRGIAEKTAKRIKLLYPTLRIAGTFAGGPEDRQTIERIAKAKPDVLLVAFGAPKQDKFIAGLKNPVSNFGFRISNLLCMGVGGTFDYISGKTPRAPRALRILGLEWLYRLFRQPYRLARILRAVIIFPLYIVWARLTGR